MVHIWSTYPGSNHDETVTKNWRKILNPLSIGLHPLKPLKQLQRHKFKFYFDEAKSKSFNKSAYIHVVYHNKTIILLQ